MVVLRQWNTPEVNQVVPMVEVTGENDPNILLDEVKVAGNAMRKFKTPGCDGIEAELWVVLDKNRIKCDMAELYMVY